MAEMDTKNIIEVLDMLGRFKSLLGPEPNPYLPVWSALGGAFIGAVSTIIPAFIIESRKEKKEKMALTLAIYAEIKASMTIIKVRGYFEGVSHIVDEFNEGKRSEATYQIIVPDDYCIVYKNNIARVGIIEPYLQIKIVQFYQIVDAIVQDVKPGGILNSSANGKEPFQELLVIGSQMLMLGSDITDEIERNYGIVLKPEGVPIGSTGEQA